MKVSFKKLWVLCAEKEMSKAELRKQAGLSSATFTRYLSTEGLVQRLDLIDPAPENYWSKTLPDIKQRIQALPYVENVPLIEGEDDEK